MEDGWIENLLTTIHEKFSSEEGVQGYALATPGYFWGAMPTGLLLVSNQKIWMAERRLGTQTVGSAKFPRFSLSARSFGDLKKLCLRQQAVLGKSLSNSLSLQFVNPRSRKYFVFESPATARQIYDLLDEYSGA